MPFVPLYPAFFFWKTTSIHIGFSSLRFSLLHLIGPAVAKNERNHKHGSRIQSHYFKKIWEKNRVLSSYIFFWDISEHRCRAKGGTGWASRSSHHAGLKMLWWQDLVQSGSKVTSDFTLCIWQYGGRFRERTTRILCWGYSHFPFSKK